MIEKLWEAYHVLHRVAQMEEIPVQQVIRDIEDAIQEAYLSAKEGNNQEVLARWHEIPCEGEIPSALELLTYLSEKCRLR